ncbi:MAG TPA: hypothetical protein VMZ91_08280 [Candidatus Paceibacterota bacterium]|nr:hypothetical protein [Candidatus Paceibacterota bacterium]
MINKLLGYFGLIRISELKKQIDSWVDCVDGLDYTKKEKKFIQKGMKTIKNEVTSGWKYW